MNRRLAWTIGGGVAALLVAGAAVWLWQASSDVPSARATPTATSSPTPDADPRALAQQALDDHLEDCTSVVVTDGVVPEGAGSGSRGAPSSPRSTTSASASSGCRYSS